MSMAFSRSLRKCLSRRIPLWLRLMIILAQLKIWKTLGLEKISLWDPWTL